MNVRITSSQKHTLHPGVWRVGLVDTAEHARRLQHLRLCARCPGLFCHTIFTQRRHTNVKATPPASFCTTPRSAWNSKKKYYNYIGTRRASTVEQDVRLYMGFIVYMCWNKTGVDMRDILYTCIGVRCASILEILHRYIWNIVYIVLEPRRAAIWGTYCAHGLPSGYISVGYLLFLQEQIKDIIIIGTRRASTWGTHCTLGTRSASTWRIYLK